jgi:uncharacterized protein YjdB
MVTATGTGSATITASAEGKTAQATITVMADPAIALSLTSVSLTAQAGQSASQTVSVTNAGGGVLSGLSGIVTYGAGQPQGWLTASLNSTSAPATLTVGANTAGLAAGTYNATVTLRSSLFGVAEKTVNVTLTVTAAPQPQIGISGTSVSFSATAGQGNPASQTVSVTNAGEGTLNGLSGTVSYAAGQPTGWLTAALSSTSAPATLTLTANTAGLAAGTYNAAVAIRSTLSGVAEKTVNVTLTVTAAPQPQIGLSPTSISFSATAGQSNPASQTVSITNAGEGTLTGLSGTVAYGAGQPTGWLTASLNSTTAPATLTLQANAANLQTGTYNATVTIRSTLSGVAEKTVNVTLTVAQIPIATLTVTPASASVQVGSTVQLSAIARDANNNVLTGRPVAWTSSNTAIATVSTSGLVTGVAEGQVTVTATSEGKSAAATITVTRPATLVGGIINTNTTWTQANSPYHLTSTVQIGEGVTITVEPGAVINGANGSSSFGIEVFGAFRVIGSASNPVQMRNLGVSIGTNAPRSARIAIDHADMESVGLSTYWGNFTLRNSTLRRVFFGLLMGPDDVYIERNIIIDTFLPEYYGSSPGKLYFRNNAVVFNKKLGTAPVEGTLRLSTSGDRLIVEHNSFLSPGIPVLAYLSSGSGKFSAANNYWGTTDKSIIDMMIVDKSDNLNFGGYVEYEPVLTAPHPDTPRP